MPTLHDALEAVLFPPRDQPRSAIRVDFRQPLYFNMFIMFALGVLTQLNKYVTAQTELLSTLPSDAVKDNFHKATYVLSCAHFLLFMIYLPLFLIEVYSFKITLEKYAQFRRHSEFDGLEILPPNRSPIEKFFHLLVLKNITLIFLLNNVTLLTSYSLFHDARMRLACKEDNLIDLDMNWIISTHNRQNDWVALFNFVLQIMSFVTTLCASAPPIADVVIHFLSAIEDAVGTTLNYGLDRSNDVRTLFTHYIRSRSLTHQEPAIADNERSVSRATIQPE